ncbi:MAG: hypothetical protein NTV93_09845 [Verrucomicrobia bacterium]|nr:hypothetical protein [Verrucomicrobiota bacterium]
MTKNDWTVLFVRVVGLYLVATHLASFVTTSASLIVALTQAMDKRQVSANIYMWQGPVVSGLVLILKASTISTAIQKHDRS